MEKAKEVINDPAKLEEALKQAWKKLDPEGKGFTSYDTLRENLKVKQKLWDCLKESLHLKKEKVLKN